MLLAVPQFDLNDLLHELDSLNPSFFPEGNLKGLFEDVRASARELWAEGWEDVPLTTRIPLALRLAMRTTCLHVMVMYLASLREYPHQIRLCERLVEVNLRLLAMMEGNAADRMERYRESYHLVHTAFTLEEVQDMVRRLA